MSQTPGPAEADQTRERCPTCNAPRRGAAICSRCQTDLGPLVRLEERADLLRARARRCYARGWYRQASSLAGEVVSLERTAQDIHLLACASLMAGDFPGALAAFRA